MLSVSFIVLSLVLSSCASNYVMVHGPCAVPQTQNLESVLASSRDILSDQDCTVAFDKHFENLLMVAEGRPGENNNRRFSDFLQWSEKNGIIGNANAKQRYTRYFSRTFVSLPDEYSNCSSACPRISSVKSEMRVELNQKERGSRILSNKQLMLDAHQDYRKVQLLLEATCTSCRANAI